MPQSHPSCLAVNAIEQMVSPFVTKKQYDVLLVLQSKHGVSLVHSLAAAVYAGKHEQAQWLLDRGVLPNARVLHLAICKSRQITARVLPYVDKFEPEHADIAASTGHEDLLEKIVDSGVYPSAWAYRFIARRGTDNPGLPIAVLMKKGEPWRIGSQALLDLMPRLTSQQIEHSLSLAPRKFNREKLLARALRCGSDAVVQEIAHYGFGTKVTARVALRTIGAKLKHLDKKSLLRYASVNKAVMRLATLHNETRSEPLASRVLCRLLSGVVRNYITTFWGDESERGNRKRSFQDAIENVMKLGDPTYRAEVIRLYAVQFLIDRVESSEAQTSITLRDDWPKAYNAFVRFRDEFEAYLQEQARPAEAVGSVDLGDTLMSGR
jgi:hypothetical protein